MEQNQDMDVDTQFQFDDEISRVQEQVQKYITTVADAVEYIQRYSVPTPLKNEKSMADSQFDIERK